jgi:hypothetical protein
VLLLNTHSQGTPDQYLIKLLCKWFKGYGRSDGEAIYAALTSAGNRQHAVHVIKQSRQWECDLSRMKQTSKKIKRNVMGTAHALKVQLKNWTGEPWEGPTLKISKSRVLLHGVWLLL